MMGALAICDASAGDRSATSASRTAGGGSSTRMVSTTRPSLDGERQLGVGRRLHAREHGVGLVVGQPVDHGAYGGAGEAQVGVGVERRMLGEPARGGDERVAIVEPRGRAHTSARS